MAYDSYPGSKLVVDGGFGKFTIYALQYNLKYKWYGGIYRRVCDGVWGYYTALALQQFLKNKGHYKHAVDGNAGTQTWSALKKYLDTQGINVIMPPMSWPEPPLARGIQMWMNKVR